MNLLDQPAGRWILYQTLSGNLFYAAIALLLLAAAMRGAGSWWPMYRWRRFARAFCLLGVIALVPSISAMTLRWLVALVFVLLTMLTARDSRRNRATMGIASLALILSAAGVSWYDETATWQLPLRSLPQVVVYADSLGTDFGVNKGEGWPALLDKLINAQVFNAAAAGAAAHHVAASIEKNPPQAYTVIIAIGGNDFLSATSLADYAHDLTEIMTRLRDGGNQIIWIEVPAPPTAPWYGWVQRYAAWKHGVTVLPKRILAATLFNTPGSTVDGLHLSAAGHAKLAQLIASRKH